MLVGVDAISLFYDRDCTGGIVLSIGVLMVAKGKPHTILDCIDALMATHPTSDRHDGDAVSFPRRGNGDGCILPKSRVSCSRLRRHVG